MAYENNNIRTGANGAGVYIGNAVYICIINQIIG